MTTETTSSINGVSSAINMLNVLNNRQKLGIVLMGLLITVIYPVVTLMIVLTIVVVYYVIHRDREKQNKIQLTGVDTDGTVVETIKKVKFCTNCGEAIEENNKFCGGCGQNNMK